MNGCLCRAIPQRQERQTYERRQPRGEQSALLGRANALELPRAEQVHDGHRPRRAQAEQDKDNA